MIAFREKLISFSRYFSMVIKFEVIANCISKIACMHLEVDSNDAVFSKYNHAKLCDITTGLVVVNTSLKFLFLRQRS